MKATTAVIILTIVVTTQARASEHLLDDSGRALSAGDLNRAIEGYNRANAEEGTCVGYNNLGVALERAGRFEDAPAAYQQAQQLANEATGVKTNLIRSQVRAAIQRCRPYAALAFLGLSGALALIRLIRAIVPLWVRMRRAIGLRKVKVTNLSHSVQCRGGDYQPDGKVYPDSEKIIVKAAFLAPGGRDVYPLQFKLEVIQPDGGTWRTLQETLGSDAVNEANVRFQIEELLEVLERPGIWKARLMIEQIQQTLGEIELTVVSQNDLIADLEATDCKLIAVCGDLPAPENVIFPDVEAVVPYAIIRCRQYHPVKFLGMQLRLDLVSVDGADEAESQRVPLELAHGQMQFCSISRPIANEPLAQRTGRWEFRLFVEGRLLAQIPFVITTFEQAVKSIKIEAFDIAGTMASGQIERLRKAADASKLQSLTPVITLSAAFPSQRVRYPMILAACVDGEPIGVIESKLVVNRNSGQLIPGEFPVPPFANGRYAIKLSFVLIVRDRLLAERSLVLKRQRPRCADSQGRIDNSPSANQLDYESEAADILGKIQVVSGR